jgi:DNA-binding transcriptional LysR family regulator
MEMTSHSAIQHAFEAGLGVVSIHTLELEPEAGRLVILDVEGFPIACYRYLLTYAGKRLPPVAQAFFDFLVGEDAAQLMQPGQLL